MVVVVGGSGVRGRERTWRGRGRLDWGSDFESVHEGVLLELELEL